MSLANQRMGASDKNRTGNWIEWQAPSHQTIKAATSMPLLKPAHTPNAEN
ncbi:hypothetical protein PoMZ_07848 [Pyricularia oryzae]|uniref:Uncharacterized protein n=2 Tax=Pyricularia oryzae TaxID=318829 RepID=A0A4P7NG50_PYROR|nr:hypothetical protein PoMZ_07848 [Pyricularia oryzae]